MTAIRLVKFLVFSTVILAALCSSITFSPIPALAMSEEEKSFLQMYFTDDELQVVSATRSLKPISRVAENMTVVTAADIELMNAHTLADVLNTVNGVQVNAHGGPGSGTDVYIQGSEVRHVAVFIDGISLNNLSDNLADVASVPVQNIEKIEIIKGPASSAWGSSLGGVINVITKSPGSKEKINGTLQASYGSQDTGDFKAEAYGKKDSFGYYLSVGRLQSGSIDGLRPNNDFSEDNLYTKLSLDISKSTNILLTTLFDKGTRGMGEYQESDFSLTQRIENMMSSISMTHTPNDTVSITLTARSSYMISDFDSKTLSTGIVGTSLIRDHNNGAGAKAVWHVGVHDIVAGVDYDSGVFNSSVVNDHRVEKWAAYANDTIFLHKFSITPGIRYDNNSISGDFVSPSLGATYELFKKTLIRTYIARGFNSPPVGYTSGSNPLMGYKANPDLKPEEVWSYQAGVETGALNIAWLKASFFRHTIKDALVGADLVDPVFVWTFVNKDKVRRQGAEFEFKTIPVYYFTLSAGATLIDTRNDETDEKIRGVPRDVYDIGIKYDNEKVCRALLKGHYIWWNTDSPGKYNSMIVDANLTKKIYIRGTNHLEAFFTAHNLFNGSQYFDSTFKNPRRWLEGGLRYKF